ncbi:MAG: hypothetical protein ACOZCO_10630 [Bacteroidota bacterium]
MENIKQTLDLRPYTMKEMRNLYGVSLHVFNNLIKSFQEELGPVRGKYLTVNQVELILKKIGTPKKLTLE